MLFHVRGPIRDAVHELVEIASQLVVIARDLVPRDVEVVVARSRHAAMSGWTCGTGRWCAGGRGGGEGGPAPAAPAPRPRRPSRGGRGVRGRPGPGARRPPPPHPRPPHPHPPPLPPAPPL